MLGDFSNPDGRARAASKDSVLAPSGSRRNTVAGLHRRVRGREDVPASGQIVLRSSGKILR
jgi:hypothetical protein